MTAGNVFNPSLPAVPDGCTNITVKMGDIMDATTQTIVNTVNCVGVMGSGLALQMKEKYPMMFERYKELCEMGKINVGVLYVYKASETRKILNFPTKVHWKYGSKIEYIVAGLRKFVDKYEDYGITSIAFPMLGCRNGGLTSDVVFSVMCSFLKEVKIPVEIWIYNETPAPESYSLF